jgi:hypothetical protein
MIRSPALRVNPALPPDRAGEMAAECYRNSAFTPPHVDDSVEVGAWLVRTMLSKAADAPSVPTLTTPSEYAGPGRHLQPVRF